ncbi:hypothetical protein [Hymenobacter glacieicola]|uniref:Uncharacterized protein n=1 Tax=Hymenobacter glacieicola TaxID=1562124 RepID=A0ABQ1WLI3_9BACT|nr:hypothetical protein [Hymenobacter glacieicola]GGG35742.1 hypothetical protein GCM10011378_10000 [Hymenobacter glacieicola]
MRSIVYAHLPDPAQLPQLTIEQPAHDEAEAARLQQLTQLIDATNPLPDLRDLAPTVRELFPEPAYLVGCGGAHIWLHRTADNQRLALVC